VAKKLGWGRGSEIGDQAGRLIAKPTNGWSGLTNGWSGLATGWLAWRRVTQYGGTSWLCNLPVWQGSFDPDSIIEKSIKGEYTGI
jgi:hypothetical protein